MSAPAAVCFDLDGVLVDSRAPYVAAVNAALAERGLPTREPEALHRFLGPPVHHTMSELADGAARPEVDALVAAYRRHYARVYLSETRLQPGIADAVAELAELLPLGVATSKPRHFAAPLLEALGLSERFQVICGPSLTATEESKAQTLDRALTDLGVDGSRAALIGDTPFDVEGAHANGARCVAVSWGIASPQALLDAGADALVGHPRELRGALGL